MAAADAITNILQQVLDEYGARLSIDAGSHVLVSDAAIAKSLFTATEAVRTPYGPIINVASRGAADQSQVEGIKNASVETVENLMNKKQDHFTHAVFGVNSEDPKYILEGLKTMRHCLRPKGYAVVISLKTETKAAEDGGEATVSLEDKLKYQSKGKVTCLSDVLEYAEFERGRIRSVEMTSDVKVNGKAQEAEVILAAKWDQLSA